MTDSDQCDTPQRARKKHRRPWYWLRRSFHRMVDLYLVSLQANPLMRVLMPKWVARRNKTNMTFRDLLRTLQSSKRSGRRETVGLIVTSTAAVIVSVSYCYLQMFSGAGASARVISTQANESITADLADGSICSLGGRSTVRVTVAAQQQVADLVEGEAMFEVRRSATKPLVVDTFLARATAPPGAKFRVATGSGVEFQVYEGLVQVHEKRAKAGTPALQLKKGDFYRVPVDGSRVIVADRRGSVGAGGADG